MKGCIKAGVVEYVLKIFHAANGVKTASKTLKSRFEALTGKIFRIFCIIRIP